MYEIIYENRITVYRDKSYNIIDLVHSIIEDSPDTRIILDDVNKNFLYLSLMYSDIVLKYGSRPMNLFLLKRYDYKTYKMIKSKYRNTSEKRTYVYNFDDEHFIVRRILGKYYIENIKFRNGSRVSIWFKSEGNPDFVPYVSYYNLNKLQKINKKVFVENYMSFYDKIPDNTEIKLSNSNIPQYDSILECVFNGHSCIVSINNRTYNILLERVTPYQRIFTFRLFPLRE